jgi:hypothetical protein
MFCAFDGPPKIVRFHGVGKYCVPGSVGFQEVARNFHLLPGTRGIVRCKALRISDSCGFSVPLYDFKEERQTLVKWAESKGAEGVQKYQEERNAKSLDGLPGLSS